MEYCNNRFVFLDFLRRREETVRKDVNIYNPITLLIILLHKITAEYSPENTLGLVKGLI